MELTLARLMEIKKALAEADSEFLSLPVIPERVKMLFGDDCDFYPDGSMRIGETTFKAAPYLRIW